MSISKDTLLLMNRLVKDSTDYEEPHFYSKELSQYLQKVLDDGNFTHEVAIGCTKQALSKGLHSLTEVQLKAIAIEMINNNLYMSRCPNEWCGAEIPWADMDFALWQGQCNECNYRQEKIISE